MVTSFYHSLFASLLHINTLPFSLFPQFFFKFFFLFIHSPPPLSDTHFTSINSGFTRNPFYQYHYYYYCCCISTFNCSYICVPLSLSLSLFGLLRKQILLIIYNFLQACFFLLSATGEEIYLLLHTLLTTLIGSFYRSLFFFYFSCVCPLDHLVDSMLFPQPLIVQSQYWRLSCSSTMLHLTLIDG